MLDVLDVLDVLDRYAQLYIRNAIQFVKLLYSTICSHSKPLPPQRRHNRLYMPHVPRFNHHVEFCLFQRHRLHHALVDDFDDVGVLSSDR